MAKPAISQVEKPWHATKFVAVADAQKAARRFTEDSDLMEFEGGWVVQLPGGVSRSVSFLKVGD